MRTRLCLVIAAAACLGAAAPGAKGAGAPVPVDQAFGRGVLSPDRDSRFVALRAREGTLVMRISTDGGEVEEFEGTDGTYAVPAVALDATAGGISADGETLVLIDPRRTYPREVTELKVYDARRLREKPARVRLRGDFDFDALSPDGKTLYLIEYTHPRDPGEYRVRAYDLAEGALEPDPILDPDEEPGEMRGLAQTRVTSPDGRWEYTLYDGGEHPFIHALDVVDSKTVCIDLEMVTARQTAWAELTIQGDGAIELTDEKGNLRAVVDTDTHEAFAPGEAGAPGTDPARAESSGPEAAGLAAGALILVALTGLAIRRMRN